MWTGTSPTTPAHGHGRLTIDQRGVIDLPEIGFGTYPMRGQQAAQAVSSALRVGYRLIDTAVNYRNEDAVARGIDGSGVDRSEVIVTTKLPGRDHGYDATLRSFESSCKRLGGDVIDLYLIHWPNPSIGRYVDSWRAMVQLHRDGRARAIGTSNFTEEHIERVADATGVLPAVNQIELHPYFPQEKMRAFHSKHGIVTEAWSPLGKGSGLFDEPAVRAAATRLGATPAQVVLRWHVQLGSVPIPKSADPSRQRENLESLDLRLTDEETEELNALGRPDGRLFGGDPNRHEEM